jgi:hypothetical protein
VEKMNKSFKVLRLGILLMIIFSSLTMFTNVFTDDAEAAAQGLPTVSISLTDQSRAASVGPGELGTVTFNGIVQVAQNQATRVVVSLAAEDTWGSAVVSPSTLLFTQDGSQPYSVSVRARPRESFNTIGIVTVTGRWRMYPGTLGGAAEPASGATGRIDISQFFKFTLKSEKAFIETSPGSQVAFTLIIQNRGNFMDTFSIDILNEDKLNKKDFSVILTQPTIEILETGEDNVRLQVNTPLDWTLYKVEYTTIKMQVSSDRGVPEGVAPQVLRFVVREKGFYIPGFDTTVMMFSMLFLIIFISYGYKTYGRPRRK